MSDLPGSFSHVAVIGPGAIGLVYAVRLASCPGGPAVTVIDHRADRAARLSARPLALDGPEGRLEARLAVRPAPDRPADLVLLATKAFSVRAAAESARPWIGRAPILTIQNGLGAADEVRAALPASTVLTGVSYQAAHVVAEGEVRHVAGGATHVGYEGRPADDLARRVAALLDEAGLPARAEPDMRPLVWGKLLVNAAINPAAALAGVENGQVAVRPTLRALAEAIAEEGQAVARAAGVALPYPSAAEAALRTARDTADNRCSMLQDLEAARPTEIEYLNGAIAREAGPRGVPVPVNRAVAALVRQVSGLAAGRT